MKSVSSQVLDTTDSFRHFKVLVEQHYPLAQLRYVGATCEAVMPSGFVCALWDHPRKRGEILHRRPS